MKSKVRTIRGRAGSASRKTRTVHFNLRVPRDVMNALRREARQQKCTIAQVIIAALNRRALELAQVKAPGGLIASPVPADDPYTIRDMP